MYRTAGLQWPGGTVQDGLVHSIYDVESPVNKQLLEQIYTQQLKRWFGNSQVVNEDGSPKVMHKKLFKKSEIVSKNMFQSAGCVLS